MASAALWPSSAENIFLYLQFWKICGFSRIAFSREGLQRQTAFPATAPFVKMRLEHSAERNKGALFYHPCKLCGKGSIQRADGIRVRLDLGPVIGEQPIHLILHIRQLGIHQRRESFFQLGQHCA